MDSQSFVLCSEHKRKRRLLDLIVIPGTEFEGPLYRCLPQRACMEEQNAVVCVLHNRKRNMVQCHEVSPGVWECKPGHTCRSTVPEVGAPGVTGIAAIPPATMTMGGSNLRAMMMPPQSFQAAPDESPMPSQSSVLAMPGPPSFSVNTFGGSSAVTATPMSDDYVWCAKYGKRLPRNMCMSVFGLYFVCQDPAIAQATELQPAHVVAQQGCEVLICSKHNLARRAQFLELYYPRIDNASNTTNADQSNEKASGYVCRSGHACRVSHLL